MQISDRHIDDFKIDRKGITPPLPVILRLVPLLFYCSIAVAISLCSLFFLQFRLAIKKRDDYKLQTVALNSQKQEIRNQRAALEARIKKATDIQSWVESSRPIQPLVLGITRSMAPKTSIIDLRLDRVDTDPSQIKLFITIGTDSTKQLDVTMEQVLALDYRAFSPRREFGRGELNFNATLVRKNMRQAAEEALPKGP